MSGAATWCPSTPRRNRARSARTQGPQRAHEYSAVIECVPPESELVTHAEFPCTTGSAVHPAMAPAPSRKLMRPAAGPAAPGTVAVKVTACPPVEGFGDPERMVVEDRVGL